MTKKRVKKNAKEDIVLTKETTATDLNEVAQFDLELEDQIIGKSAQEQLNQLEQGSELMNAHFSEADLIEDEDSLNIRSKNENSDDQETSDFVLDVSVDVSIFENQEIESESFLPEVGDEDEIALADGPANVYSVEGTELDGFESAEIEELDFIEEERLESIVESILFASDRPVSLASLKLVFKGTNVNGQKLRRVLDQLAVEYAGGRRGVTLEEVPGGYQLRTKIDNLDFIKNTLKVRQFKLSGPALEVLAISAYKQPIVKSEIDEIRGVESGHLLRALMEKGLVNFDGKSELPGRPMQYATTKKFLEIFGLRSLKELPTLSQIDDLLPDGIGEDETQAKPTLSQITDAMSEQVVTGVGYSQGEDELMKIEEQIGKINTSTDFFEKEKIRQKEKRDEERAQNIRDAITMGDPVSTRDMNWLSKYDEAIAQGTTLAQIEILAKQAKLQTLNQTPNQDISNGSDLTTEEAQAHENFESELNQAINDFESDQDAALVSSDLLASGEQEFLQSDEFSEDDVEAELPYLGDAEDIDESDIENNI